MRVRFAAIAAASTLCALMLGGCDGESKREVAMTARPAPAPASSPAPSPPATGPNTESYAPIVENSFRKSDVDPLSTFGIDVDTASYANVRRFLTQNMMPPKAAVR